MSMICRDIYYYIVIHLLLSFVTEYCIADIIYLYFTFISDVCRHVWRIIPTRQHTDISRPGTVSSDWLITAIEPWYHLLHGQMLSCHWCIAAARPGIETWYHLLHGQMLSCHWCIAAARHDCLAESMHNCILYTYRSSTYAIYTLSIDIRCPCVYLGWRTQRRSVIRVLVRLHYDAVPPYLCSGKVIYNLCSSRNYASEEEDLHHVTVWMHFINLYNDIWYWN